MELREVFEPIVNFLKNLQRKDKDAASKDYAKERLQLVLMQDRASVSPDFFEMMKKEIIEVIKKYIEIDEESLEVQLTRGFEDGNGTGPALFANIPIKNIKPVAKKVEEKEDEELVTEIVNNEEIIEEINADSVGKGIEASQEKNSGDNANPSSEVIANVPENKFVDSSTIENNLIENNLKEEFSKENSIVNNNTEKGAMTDVEVKEKISTENISVEAAGDKQNAEIVKEKIAEVKDGVVETIEKVKKGAKDGIKKIKTKTQKKKINE